MTTLDVLSGGRTYFGIGAGWYEEEALGLGTPFPRVTVRFEQLEETLQIVHQMWRDDVTPFVGKHFKLTEPINHPQPLTQPHPRILIGSEGERKGLRLVAQYADACNFYFGSMSPTAGEWHKARFQNSIAHLQHKWRVLERHCHNLDRDPSTIEFTVLGTIDPSQGNTAQQIIDQFGKMREIGVDHVIVNIPNVHELKPLEMLVQDVLPVTQSW